MYHGMKVCEEVEVQLHFFLTSALDKDAWSVLYSCCLTLSG